MVTIRKKGKRVAHRVEMPVFVQPSRQAVNETIQVILDGFNDLLTEIFKIKEDFNAIEVNFGETNKNLIENISKTEEAVKNFVSQLETTFMTTFSYDFETVRMSLSDVKNEISNLKESVDLFSETNQQIKKLLTNFETIAGTIPEVITSNLNQIENEFQEVAEQMNGLKGNFTSMQSQFVETMDEMKGFSFGLLSQMEELNAKFDKLQPLILDKETNEKKVDKEPKKIKTKTTTKDSSKEEIKETDKSSEKIEKKTEET